MLLKRKATNTVITQEIRISEVVFFPSTTELEYAMAKPPKIRDQTILN